MARKTRRNERLDRWQEHDPHQSREARRYAHPIPSRSYLLEALEQLGRPMPLGAFAEALGLDRDRDREALEKRLQAMVRDGQLLRNRKDEYCLVTHLPVVVGRVTGHRDGFGFLIPEDGGEDIFLAPRQMHEIFHGDRVAVRIKGRDRRGRPEGALVEVLERGSRQIVGRYFREGGIGFVVPDNPRIHHHLIVPPTEAGEARPGKIVLAEIVEEPTRHSEPIGRIVRLLGDDDQPGIETEIAIHSYALPHVWPEALAREIARLESELPAAAKRGREDLRSLPLVTIDGADARDFDDAVYCELAGQGWRLLVAIADVSHYVQPATALDAEAQNRGTSVYFPNRVIPMLPEVLSTGLCSLNPQVDRLCMVCDMRVDRDGKVTRSRFYRAVMRSAARLTYGEVARMLLANDQRLRRRYKALLPSLEQLAAVYRALKRARDRRGALDLDLPEVRFLFDERGRVSRIEPYERNDAHRLIEEAMIAANVQAARFLKRQRMPTLYRVHEGPDPDRLEELRTFLNALGLRAPSAQRLDSLALSRLIRRVQSRPDAVLIETVILRSMAQAVYQPQNIGHFGLALPEYLHFTSPIRRYPDLLVHRAIGHVLAGGEPAGFRYRLQDMEVLGVSCSMTERRADEASREAMSWLKCEFMQNKVGEEFDGLVSGVTDFGLFVQLIGLQIEGLAHVTSLANDYYRHDRVHHRLVGERTGRVYRLTDPIRVRVVRVSLEERKIDFEPVGRAPDPPAVGRRRRPA